MHTVVYLNGRSVDVARGVLLCRCEFHPVNVIGMHILEPVALLIFGSRSDSTLPTFSALLWHFFKLFKHLTLF